MRRSAGGTAEGRDCPDYVGVDCAPLEVACSPIYPRSRVEFGVDVVPQVGR